MTDYEKVLKIKETFGLTWDGLAKKIGIASPQTFQDIKGGRIGISPRLKGKLRDAYPNLNPLWLNTGDGDMFLSMPVTKPLAENLSVSRESRRVNLGDLFPTSEFVCVYYGSGMPEFPNGCLLALTRVEDIYGIMPGKPYMIVTDGFSDIRVVTKSEKQGCVRLAASDTSTLLDGSRRFPDFNLETHSIRNIFKITGMAVSFDSEPMLDD